MNNKFDLSKILRSPNNKKAYHISRSRFISPWLKAFYVPNKASEKKDKKEIQNDWLLKLEEIKRSTWSWNSSTGFILCIVSYNIPRKLSKKLLYCSSDNARTCLLFINLHFYPYLSPPLKLFSFFFLLFCAFFCSHFFWQHDCCCIFSYVLSNRWC